jgi:hypothetical protein
LISKQEAISEKLTWLQMFQRFLYRSIDNPLRINKIAPLWNASVAQLAEQLTLNQLVDGSSPSRGTTSAFIPEQVDDTDSRSNQNHQPEQAPCRDFEHRQNLAPLGIKRNRAFYA